jgi:hypothetical protein
VIRQAISCDICGTEMLNANHWFVAYDHGAELRISAWNPRNRLRTAARHLCGHKCLHKLVDDFTARTLTTGGPAAAESDNPNRARTVRSIASTDTGLARVIAPRTALPIIGACSEAFESSARLIRPSVQKVGSNPVTHRAEAWKRERERQQQAEKTASSRRSIA